MGCKANVYDSLVLDKELSELGGQPAISHQDCDVFVLNSCTVTEQADKQAIQDVTLVKKKNPNAITVFTGCLAQVSNPSIDTDIWVGNNRKSQIQSLVAEKLGIEFSPKNLSEENEIYWGQLPLENERTRAFLKIQEGCNDFCTYCIIPYARGKSRSVPLESILNEVRRLVDCGIQEVVLTGTNIADYGVDLGLHFDYLVEEILEKTPLGRLRLSSLDPTEISDRLLKLMSQSDRLMPHFHISLQSPVSRVLRAMKRHYRREDVVDCLNKIQKINQNIFIGMDVITGFPSETLQEHEEAVETLKSLSWSRLHIFPYSEREGTPATKIPGSVPIQERKRRARELMEISSQRHHEFMESKMGTIVDGALWERPIQVGTEVFIAGHLPNYCRVVAKVAGDLESAMKLRNRVTKAKIVSMMPKPAQDWTFEAEIMI